MTGFSLEPPTEPSLFVLAGLAGEERLTQVTGDVRDLAHLKDVFRAAQPDVVFHLAAQPIVRQSYRDPVGTYKTNVMGTVNLLECVRLARIPAEDGGLCSGTWEGVRSVLNVTTDKVYENKEWSYGYREVDPLDGFDPYSNSKSCSELVTHAYRNSFFADGAVRVSTARAGNVIGGGDFSPDRIVPDCVRAAERALREGASEGEIIVRNPGSTRPYQHVLEPLFAYLAIAAAQAEDPQMAGYYNVGPDDADCICTGDLVDMFCAAWNEAEDGGLRDAGYEAAVGSSNAIGGSSSNVSMPKLVRRDQVEAGAPHEANYLKLDCSKLKSALGWRPRWHIDKAIAETVRFSKLWLSGADAQSIRDEMDWEMGEYLADRVIQESCPRNSGFLSGSHRNLIRVL